MIPKCGALLFAVWIFLIGSSSDADNVISDCRTFFQLKHSHWLEVLNNVGFERCEYSAGSDAIAFSSGRLTKSGAIVDFRRSMRGGELGHKLFVEGQPMSIQNDDYVERLIINPRYYARIRNVANRWELLEVSVFKSSLEMRQFMRTQDIAAPVTLQGTTHLFSEFPDLPDVKILQFVDSEFDGHPAKKLVAQFPGLMGVEGAADLKVHFDAVTGICLHLNMSGKNAALTKQFGIEKGIMEVAYRYKTTDNSAPLIERVDITNNFNAPATTVEFRNISDAATIDNKELWLKFYGLPEPIAAPPLNYVYWVVGALVFGFGAWFVGNRLRK